ncbi:hypothetical protein HN51_052545 [Arachis hypogaea]|nr:uncharacterized protein DS421_17g596590 [Arachis hypogaea]
MEDHRHRRQPLLLSVPATEGDDLVTPQSIGENAVDGEKSSAAAALAAAATAGRMKNPSVKSKSGPKTAWRKLLSQCSQMINLLKAIMKTPHFSMCGLQNILQDYSQNWLPSNSVIEQNPAFFNTRDIVILKIIPGFPILTKVNYMRSFTSIEAEQSIRSQHK